MGGFILCCFERQKHANRNNVLPEQERVAIDKGIYQLA